MSRFTRSHTLLTILLVLVLALAAYLRLANSATTPGWYSDEGTHIDIAQNLLRGRVQYMAINQSWLLFGRPPLFEFALAGVFRLAGPGIASLRAFTGALGVITVGVLYAAVRRLSRDSWLALLAAGMLAIYPQAVLYSRFGFSYNLLAPLVVLTLWGLSEYAGTGERRWLVLASVCAGLGLISDLEMGAFILPLALIVLARRPQDLAWGLPLIVLPFAVYSLLMLLSVPNAFLFDLQYTLSRLGGHSIGEQISTLALNVTTLLSQDFWVVGGAIGLFLLRPRRLGGTALVMVLAALAVLGRTVALYSLSAYYMIPLLPLIAVGMASLVRYGLPYTAHMVSDGLTPLLAGIRSKMIRGGIARAGAWLVALAIIGTPLVTTLWLEAGYVQTGFPTAIDSFLINPADAHAAADFLADYTNSNSVIIASPATAWLFDAHVADFQMSISATGVTTPHLPGDTPPDRFAFDPRFANADFAVVDNLWRSWGAANVPELSALLADIETWPLVFQSGAVSVYRNPGK